MSIELVMPFNHLILCRPLLLPSIFPSIRVFSNESVLCIRWSKYWSFSFSFSISPSNEYSGLISFRMDWFNLLTVQGTIKSLFQHRSSKASILQCSAFCTVQLSHPCALKFWEMLPSCPTHRHKNTEWLSKTWLSKQCVYSSTVIWQGFFLHILSSSKDYQTSSFLPISKIKMASS